MVTKFGAAAALAVSALVAAAPAQGAVTLTTGSFGTGYGVHGDGGNQSGNSVGGNVNNASKLGLDSDQAKVTFSSGSSLNLKGGGEATVTGSMGDLHVLFGSGWNAITFAFQNLKGTDFSHFKLIVTDSTGDTTFDWAALPSCAICKITGAGENKFQVTGEGITNLAFSFDPAVGTAKQFRVEGVFTSVPGGVPEPATWALMIMGFGAVGGVMRARRQEVRFAA